MSPFSANAMRTDPYAKGESGEDTRRSSFVRQAAASRSLPFAGSIARRWLLLSLLPEELPQCIAQAPSSPLTGCLLGPFFLVTIITTTTCTALVARAATEHTA